MRKFLALGMSKYTSKDFHLGRYTIYDKYITTTRPEIEICYKVPIFKFPMERQKYKKHKCLSIWDTKEMLILDLKTRPEIVICYKIPIFKFPTERQKYKKYKCLPIWDTEEMLILDFRIKRKY